MTLEEALNKIEVWCGLHQEVIIIYVVDGYEVSLMKDDGNITEYIACGKTLKETLIEVASNIK